MSNWETIKKLYIDNNIKIFPVVENGKTPLISDWLNECSSDYFQNLYWYTNSKNCNFGLPATPNNLFILDLDVHDENKNGIESFKRLLSDVFNFPFDVDINDVCATLIQQTPSGGIHIIYKSDDELKDVLNGANVFKDYLGIDIRTQGFIVAEPSTINNKPYKFLNDTTPQPMPQELKKFILENATLKNDIKKELYKKPTNVEVGDRDNQLFSYINNIYYKTRLDYDEILCLALNFNENVLEKPFPDNKVEYKVKKVFQKDRQKMIFINLGE